MGNPDPPILAFFVFLASFRFASFFLLFFALLLSFPRISRVWQEERSLLFFFRGMEGQGTEYSEIRKPLAFWDECSKRSVLRMRFGIKKGKLRPWASFLKKKTQTMES